MLEATLAGHATVWLFRRCIHGDDPEACEMLVRGYWDRQYLRKFGVTPLPEALPPLPPRPQPDPPPWARAAELAERVTVQDHLISDLIEVMAGDPSPQPNENVVALFLERGLRLEAAKGLRQRLEKAVKGLDAEITKLEQGKR